MNKELSKAIRKIAKSRNHTAKIVVVDGDLPPIPKGELGQNEYKINGKWYTNQEIFANKALRWHFAPRSRNSTNTRWIKSTYRIEVGRDWLMQYSEPFIIKGQVAEIERGYKTDYIMDKGYTWESLNGKITELLQRDWSVT